MEEKIMKEQVLVEVPISIEDYCNNIEITVNTIGESENRWSMAKNTEFVFGATVLLRDLVFYVKEANKIALPHSPISILLKTVLIQRSKLALDLEKVKVPLLYNQLDVAVAKIGTHDNLLDAVADLVQYLPKR